MKQIMFAALAASLLAAPAQAFGPVVSLPVLQFPDGDGTISSQGCDAQNETCD